MKDNTKLEVINLEIELKTSGLSEKEVDARTRELAARLRLLPHKTVGIVNKQDPTPVNESSSGSTEGVITMSLETAQLSNVLELLRGHRDLILKGPNGILLDFNGSASEDQIEVWRNAALIQGATREMPSPKTRMKMVLSEQIEEAEQDAADPTHEKHVPTANQK